MNNGLFRLLAMVAIAVACGNSAQGSIVLSSGSSLGDGVWRGGGLGVQQASGVSSDFLTAQIGAGAASRYLDSERPHREVPQEVPAQEPGLYRPAYGGSMDGTGGVPGYRTVLGEYAATLEAMPTQESSLVFRIQGEFKLVWVNADPLGLLRPPEGTKLQSSLNWHLV